MITSTIETVSPILKFHFLDLEDYDQVILDAIEKNITHTCNGISGDDDIESLKLEIRNCFEVVMDRLLSEAEFLLLSSDMEVKAIGFELGFVTLQNFIMYFIRWRGMTPLAFRERERGKAGE